MAYQQEMLSLTSAAEHMKTKEIRHHIAKYAGCPNITDDAKSCRWNFSMNKFVDPIGGQKWDCNWYCMRNCSPEKLLPIFTKIPHHIIAGNGRPVKIIWINFIFNEVHIGLRMSQHYNPIKQQYDNEPLWYWDNPKLDYRARQLFRSSGYEIKDLANKLCKWFKDQPISTEIKFIGQVMTGDYRTTKEQMESQGFIGFDKPFLRPNMEWKISGMYIETSFTLIPERISVSVPEEKLKESSIMEILPIGLAEIDETPSLINYGIAHPELHRVSRKRRSASRYRPRHFHSPTRKDVVNRSARTRK